MQPHRQLLQHATWSLHHPSGFAHPHQNPQTNTPAAQSPPTRHGWYVHKEASIYSHQWLLAHRAKGPPSPNPVRPLRCHAHARRCAGPSHPAVCPTHTTHPQPCMQSQMSPRRTVMALIQRKLSVAQTLGCAALRCAALCRTSLGLTHSNLAPALRQQQLCACRPYNPGSCRLLPAHSCKLGVVCSIDRVQASTNGVPTPSTVCAHPATQSARKTNMGMQDTTPSSPTTGRGHKPAEALHGVRSNRDVRHPVLCTNVAVEYSNSSTTPKLCGPPSKEVSPSCRIKGHVGHTEAVQDNW
jgi:hypothetical protein